ncbi:MAG: glycine cleavage system protein GcvH [Firmicutes bacterium]|nr:glycine cleavage system protein GcvH [Bacillota bacterium]
MKVLEGLKYSKDHEWVRVEGNKAYLGITDYAQSAMGNIVFVELPEEGAEVGEGESIGVVESVKSASDLYSPLSGVVVEINEELEDMPEKINQEPYESWIAAVELNNAEELDNLMGADDYIKFLEGEA